MNAKFYVLDNDKRTSVHHNAGCRCLREHGPYKVHSAREIKGLRACRYCGGGNDEHRHRARRARPRQLPRSK